MVLELSYSVVLGGWVAVIYIKNKAIGIIDIYEYINKSDIPGRIIDIFITFNRQKFILCIHLILNNIWSFTYRTSSYSKVKKSHLPLIN